jgi:trk system potassium uptake protein TrkA
VARETFAVERVMAKIKDPRRAAIYERLGISTIATVQWATERVLHRILPERATVDWIDPSARVVLVERPLPPAWAGRTVTDIDLAGRGRVVALTRLGEARLPGPDLVAQEDDMVHVAVAGDHVDAFDAHLAGGPTGPAGSR